MNIVNELELWVVITHCWWRFEYDVYPLPLVDQTHPWQISVHVVLVALCHLVMFNASPYAWPPPHYLTIYAAQKEPLTGWQTTFFCSRLSCTASRITICNYVAITLWKQYISLTSIIYTSHIGFMWLVTAQSDWTSVERPPPPPL